MNTHHDDPEDLAREIAATQEKLEALEKEIAEIGGPAAQHLRERLAAVTIEERALQRNFAEALAARAPDEQRLAKVERLLHHIEREEASIEHAADFLHQAAPSTVELAVRGGSKVLDAGARKLKAVLGADPHVWQSPLVNKTLESLEARYGDSSPEEE